MKGIKQKKEAFKKRKRQKTKCIFLPRDFRVCRQPIEIQVGQNITPVRREMM